MGGAVLCLHKQEIVNNLLSLGWLILPACDARCILCTILPRRFTRQKGVLDVSSSRVSQPFAKNETFACSPPFGGVRWGIPFCSPHHRAFACLPGFTLALARALVRVLSWTSCVVDGHQSRFAARHSKSHSHQSGGRQIGRAHLNRILSAGTEGWWSSRAVIGRLQPDVANQAADAACGHDVPRSVAASFISSRTHPTQHTSLSHHLLRLLAGACQTHVCACT